MRLCVLAELLDSLRDKNMLQDLSPLKREEIVIFICEQYSDYVESEVNDEAEEYSRVLIRIAREIENAGF